MTPSGAARDGSDDLSALRPPGNLGRRPGGDRVRLIRRLRLRLILVVVLVAILVPEPPERDAAWCSGVVGGYLLWTSAVDVLGRRAGQQAARLLWLGLFVDMAVVSSLTMLTARSAAVSWTPYLLLTDFSMVPVMAAAQLSRWICVAVGVPGVAVYLGSGLVRALDDEPVAYVVLRTLLLAAVFFRRCCSPGCNVRGSPGSPTCWLRGPCCWTSWSPCSNVSSTSWPRRCTTVRCSTSWPHGRSSTTLWRAIWRPLSGPVRLSERPLVCSGRP